MSLIPSNRPEQSKNIAMLPKASNDTSVKGALLIMYGFFVYVILKYVRVTDAMCGTGAKNKIFSLYDGKFYPGTAASSSSASGGSLPFMDMGGDSGFGDHMWAALNEIQKAPLKFDGLVLSHVVVPLALMTLVFFIAVVLWRLKQQTNYQDAAGQEGGSAHFETDIASYNAKYVDPYTPGSPCPDNNMILADGLKMSMNTHKTRLNLNVLVIGGSGTGKTRFVTKPNVAQMNCCYVITDPSGELLESTGKMLLENGYKVKLFSMTHMGRSNTYNPMDYIYDKDGNIDDAKVGILVSTFIKNASDTHKSSGGDPFWTKSSTACLKAMILYLAEFRPVEERNMYNVLRLVQLGKASEGMNPTQTELDKIFDDAYNQNPKGTCFSSYRTFKLAPAKTANSILISMAVDLDPFSIDAVRNMTTTSYICTRDETGKIISYLRDQNGEPIRASDNLDLQTIGDEKTALFIDIPQTNGAYNFLISMMYSQLFEMLYTRAMDVSPNSYHIYDQYGNVLSSQYPSEEAAKRWMHLFATAEVKEYNKKFYLYNKEATQEETLPEFLGMSGGNGDFTGYIKEVYSKDVGVKLIRAYNKNDVQIPSEENDDGWKLRFRKKQTVPIQSEHDGPYIKKGGLRLPIHTRFLLDEFANIGEIPNFDKMLSTMRKYEISSTIILQSLTQLKANYDKIWEVLIGNCDTIIFLGSSENETDKYICEKLGKATIRTMDSSVSKGGSSGSQSTSYKKQARDLLDQAEVGKISNDYCLVIIRSLNPFYKKKVVWEHCEHYPETGDKDENNQLTGKFLDFYYKCLPKMTNQADMFDQIEQNSKNVIQNGTTPSGRASIGSTPQKVYNGKSAQTQMRIDPRNPKNSGARDVTNPETVPGTDIPNAEAGSENKYPEAKSDLSKGNTGNDTDVNSSSDAQKSATENTTAETDTEPKSDPASKTGSASEPKADTAKEQPSDETEKTAKTEQDSPDSTDTKTDTETDIDRPPFAFDLAPTNKEDKAPKRHKRASSAASSGRASDETQDPETSAKKDSVDAAAKADQKQPNESNTESSKPQENPEQAGMDLNTLPFV